MDDLPDLAVETLTLANNLVAFPVTSGTLGPPLTPQPSSYSILGSVPLDLRSGLKVASQSPGEFTER
jgi:hypothetical protein